MYFWLLPNGNVLETSLRAAICVILVSRPASRNGYQCLIDALRNVGRCAGPRIGAILYLRFYSMPSAVHPQEPGDGLRVPIRSTGDLEHCKQFQRLSRLCSLHANPNTEPGIPPTHCVRKLILVFQEWLCKTILWFVIYFQVCDTSTDMGYSSMRF